MQSISNTRRISVWGARADKVTGVATGGYAITALPLVCAFIMLTNNAYANFVPAGVSSEETLICTTVYKGFADVGKPLASGGPIEQMASLPTTCVGSPSYFEVRDGIRSLMSQGWRPGTLSHQITPIFMAKQAGEKTELLLSMVVVLVRAVHPVGYSR